MAWAAKATELFADYAPFSWVGMGLLGFLMMAASLALIGVMRSRFQLVALRNKVAVADFVDPMAKTFERKRIHIRDLQPPLQGHITNKVFIDCDLIGPANIVFVKWCIKRQSSSGGRCGYNRRPIDRTTLSAKCVYFKRLHVH